MRVLAVLAVLVLAAPLQAQVRYGARAGLTFAHLAGDFLLDPAVGTRTGFSAGAMGRLPLRGPFAVQGEVLYLQAGATIDGPTAAGLDGGTDANQTLELTYFEVPLLLVLDGLGTPEVGLRLHAGPSVGIEFGEVLRTEGVDGAEQPDDSTSPVLSLAAGGDLEFVLSGQRTVLGARYYHGLTDLSSGLARGPDGTPGTGSIYNRVLTVSLGVFL